MQYVSNTPNKDLMALARQALTGRWGIAIGAVCIYLAMLVVLGFVPVLGDIAAFAISGPMSVGFVIFSLAIVRGQEPKIAQIFEGFQKFWTALGAYTLMMIFIGLWSLLLIIPGIIAALSYSMTFYIIAEDDTIGAFEAIEKSKQMMLGNKWKFFCLGCRFIGWMLLCILTLGLGYIWLTPYMTVSYAEFYDDLVSKETADKIAAANQAGVQAQDNEQPPA
jgi:uncharacterized membrane protein